MEVEHRRHAGPPPDEASLDRALRSEAGNVHGWSNGPGDRYPEHEHGYAKILYCARGSIAFALGDARRFDLRPGDRLFLPAGTRHSALVGPEGCACIEGHLGVTP